ncbi:MAG: hypothetical protein KDD44_06880, partial [Bdellovibrionales bacterium]|nr:hypothetical protein [Bdellovibrionales bacterium]
MKRATFRHQVAKLAAVASLILAASAPALAVDFDNDGKDDITVFRPSLGMWFTILSLTSVGRS